MKHVCILAMVLALAATAGADPLQKEQVAADAKWLLHLDVDKLRATPAGDSFVKSVAEKALEKPRAILKEEAGVDLDLTQVSSVTAYGDYSGSNNVMLLKSDLDVEKLLEAGLAQAAKKKGLETWPFEKSIQDGVVTYRFPDHVAIWIRPDKITIFSKSPDTTARANDVLAGRAPSLAGGAQFSDFPELPKTFFFLGAAEGFNLDRRIADEAGKDGKNNPKAKILKLTESGRVVAGQDADQIFLNVALKAKTSEVVTQMQQVVQGMIALASLTKSDDENIQKLTDSAKVTTSGNVVNLSLNFPVDRALMLLNQQVERQARERELRRQTNAAPDTSEK